MNLKRPLNIILLSIILLTSTVGVYHTPIYADENLCEFIIIAPEEFTNELDRLVDHKQHLDITTRIMTIENITTGIYTEETGYDDAEQLKYFIKHAYEKWGARYVMLVGGKNHIPVRYSTMVIENDTVGYGNLYPFIDLPPLFSAMSDYISDLYYADIYFENNSFSSWDSNNNNIYGEKNLTTVIDYVDLYPDIAIGRLLCSTPKELSIIIDKIIEYETNKENTEWFQNMVVCGGDTHPVLNDIIIKLLFFGEKSLSFAFEGEYMGNNVETMLSSFNTKKIYATGFFNEESLPLTKENIENSINEGCGFLLLAGHGFPEAWGTHPPTLFGKLWLPKPLLKPSFYNITDVHQLSNNGKLPIAVISACSCGNFNETDYPFAWSFIQHENGGAIGSFACTTLGTLFPTTLCATTMNGKLSLGIFEAYDKGITRLGDIWKYSIESYLNDPDAMSISDVEGFAWINNFNIEEWILFGDPTLQLGGYNR